MSDGYSAKLLAIDDEMAALGRPSPPVVAWLRGKMPGALGSEHVRNEPEKCPCRWCVACRQHRAAVEAWEEANPDAAVRWLELRESYVSQERAELRAKYDDDAWNYEQLRHVGCPSRFIDIIRSDKNMRETASLKVAREWMLDMPWSLTLIGGTGCGKSVAAAWAAHQKLMRNFGVVWVDCAKQSEAPMYGVEAELYRHKCQTAHVVVLDDLGTPAQFARKEGAWLAWLDGIIGSRANDAKKTIVTTNRNERDLAGWLGARLFDRLRDGVIHSTREPSMRGA